MRSRAVMYLKAIHACGAPLDKFVGTTNSTRIQIARQGGQGTFEQVTYSGHKRIHCLIRQTSTTPDGLLFYMYGPEVGRRHDMTLYGESSLCGVILDILFIDGKQYCMLRDARNQLRPWIQTNFLRVNATLALREYNKALRAL